MPTIEEYKAARERLDTLAEFEKQYVLQSFGTVPTAESDFIKTIRTLLDQAINAPDLGSLKLQSNPITDSIEGLNYIHGWNHAIDHLAPRIVREGFVVVPEEPTIDMCSFGGDIIYHSHGKTTLSKVAEHTYKAMIAASKGD